MNTTVAELRAAEELALAKALLNVGIAALDGSWAVKSLDDVWAHASNSNRTSLTAIARHVQANFLPFVWHYLPELPDAETTCLISLEREDTDEVLIGHYSNGGWWQNPCDVDLYIESPVRAWAYAPAAATKKGGAK